MNLHFLHYCFSLQLTHWTSRPMPAEVKKLTHWQKITCLCGHQFIPVENFQWKPFLSNENTCMYKCFGIHYFKIIHDENRYCMTKTGKGALFLLRPFEWEYRRTCLFILWMGCSNSFPEKILLFFSKSQPNKSSNKRNILNVPD